MSRHDRFLKACRREQPDCTPIWLMRQAGRYMPEYRAIREKHPSILEMIRQPEIATEITLQPVEAFEVDAAIVFADILPLIAGMGLELEFVSGKGPVIHNPLGSAQDVSALKPVDPEEHLGFTLEAVRLSRAALDGKVPLIGFSGAPFTLACYAIEGGGSRTFERPLRFMREEGQAWHQLMDKLSQAIAAYLLAQIDAGAQAVQLFDSWAGILSPNEYCSYVSPYTTRIFDQLAGTDVPLIHFCARSAGLERELKEAGGTVLSLGPDSDLGEAIKRFGSDRAIQGNLPSDLLAEGPVERIREESAALLEAAKGFPGHIFNLGHGILKSTPVEHVKALVDFVHTY